MIKDLSIKERLALRDKYKDEKIYVIPADKINCKDKFTKMKHDKDIWKKYDHLGKYIYRYEAEYDPAFQQPIPYLIVTNKDQTHFYVTKRIGGDSRLKNLLSLGVGGHINEEDGYDEIILKCLIREMNEELNINPISPYQFLGTIRDLGSKTAEHFGLLFIVKADTDVSVKEKDKIQGYWMKKETLFDKYTLFENWSKFIIDYLYENKDK